MTEYVSCVGMNESEPFDTFTDALTDFMSRVKQMMKEGCALQVLETACWIERKDSERNINLGFYNVRDFSIKCGLMPEAGGGSLVDDPEDPGEPILEGIFLFAALNGVEAQPFIDVME